MKKKIFALLLAGVMVLSTGCSANVSVDPDTGVVFVDGVPVNELLEDTGSEDSDDAADEADEDTSDDVTKDNESEAEDGVEEYKGGLRIKFPDAFTNAKGMIYSSSYEMDDGLGVFITSFNYTGASEDWVKENIYKEDPNPEDQEKYNNSKAEFTYVLSIDNNRGLDELVEIINNTDDDNDVDENDLTEIAKVEDCTFYRLTKFDKYGCENLEDEYREEFDNLYNMFDDILENAEYFKPVEPFADIIGKKIEFTTTDIDGNPITSDEIFSQNEVTMINVWATWCYWCVDELPELNEINNRLAKKNCAIVGIVGDGTDEDSIEEAKKLLKENGDEYLNILPWEGALTDDFPMSEGWPTSFFVDREGRITGKPVIGANVKLYEEVIDKILEGETPENESEDNDMPQITGNDVNQYRIYVSDVEGNLIEGAMVQLCDDSTCRVENTDKSGLAVFKVEPTEYTVHLLKQPKGFKKDNQEYKLPAEYSDLHIILEKE